jgi:cystathionine beta-lyase/cystathionine gamma-synthase
MKREAFVATNPEHRMIRMYIGLEDADYLIKDLESAFTALK